MKCTARIIIETVNAEHLARALEPDNRDAPAHLSVECKPVRGGLECIVEVSGCDDPKRLLTLRNTVDEIIVLSRAAEEAMTAVG